MCDPFLERFQCFSRKKWAKINQVIEKLMAYDSLKLKCLSFTLKTKFMMSHDCHDVTTLCPFLSPLSVALLELRGAWLSSWEVCTHTLFLLTRIFHLHTVSLWQNHSKPLGLAKTVPPPALITSGQSYLPLLSPCTPASSCCSSVLTHAGWKLVLLLLLLLFEGPLHIPGA